MEQSEFCCVESGMTYLLSGKNDPVLAEHSFELVNEEIFETEPERQKRDVSTATHANTSHDFHVQTHTSFKHQHLRKCAELT